MNYIFAEIRIILSGVGVKAPPFFSILIANNWAFILALITFKESKFDSASNTPALMGLPSINAHNWYCMPSFLFSKLPASSGISYKHLDNPFNDYTLQRLLPQKFSQLGPFITTGDINNDGAIDFFIGGALNTSGKIFMQQAAETFSSKNLTDSIKIGEDMDCILFDADKDGDAESTTAKCGI